MSFKDDLAVAAQRDAGYDELPECIKANYSHKEWLWLPAAAKAKLIQTETEPDWNEP